jgi:hypothetical protein
MAEAVSWRPLIAGSGFDHSSLHFGIFRDELATWQDFLRVFQSVSIIPLKLETLILLIYDRHLYLRNLRLCLIKQITP